MRKISYVITGLNAYRVIRERVRIDPREFSTYGAAWQAVTELRRNRPANVTERDADKWEVRAIYKGDSKVFFDNEGCDDKALQRLDLACAVLAWAATPGEHGGNPYMLAHVKLARRIVGDE